MLSILQIKAFRLPTSVLDLIHLDFTQEIEREILNEKNSAECLSLNLTQEIEDENLLTSESSQDKLDNELEFTTDYSCFDYSSYEDSDLDYYDTRSKINPKSEKSKKKLLIFDDPKLNLNSRVVLTRIDSQMSYNLRGNYF